MGCELSDVCYLQVISLEGKGVSSLSLPLPTYLKLT